MTITATTYDAWNATMQGSDAIPADLAELLDRPAWMADAACGAHPSVDFFPGHGEPTAPAKAVCAGCPVAAVCLDFALVNREQDGVWGGTSAVERKRLRRALG